MSMWDTFSSRLEVTATLRCTTALRIGAGGESSIPSATDLPVMRTANAEPFIPGSSLRGVVRAYIERLVRSLEPQPGGGKGACDPLDLKRSCIRSGADDERPSVDEVCNGSCRVCRVFGNTYLASRVRFADLPCAGAWSVEVRDGVAIDRETETVSGRKKYDFEVVPAGTTFTMRVTADNLDAEEKGLLWLGLRELHDGHVQVGGGKGRGLGWVQLENTEIREVDASDREALIVYILQGHMPLVETSQADGWLDQLWEAMRRDS